MVSQDQHH